MYKLKLTLFFALFVTLHSGWAQRPGNNAFLPKGGLSESIKRDSTKPFKFQNGDLLFQQLQCGDLCNAIHTVTSSAHNANFSHVAILVVSGNEMYVIEAIDADVHKTPLDIFLHRSLDYKGHPLVAVGRLKNNDLQMIQMAVMNAAQYIGRPYNDAFDWNSPAMYCSQLVLKAYSINGVTIFPNVVQPMTFIDPRTHKFDPVWGHYFDKLHVPMPEGKPGCNPGALSRDALLVLFFPYSQFN